MAGDLIRDVRETLAVDREAFRERVAEEVEFLASELRAGTFNNPQAIVGLEYEFYAASEDDDRLVRVPRPLVDLIGFEKELGLHNAEMHTSPQPFNEYGLACQLTEVQSRLSAALAKTRTENIRLVSDGFWTVPPAGETAREYLTASVEDDGVHIAPNMSDSPRYHAMANSDYPAGLRLSAPHVDLEADTVMPESLTTSIQPHYQVPAATDLPERFRYALRIAGPLLALGVNSPFFPPDLYDDVDAEAVLDDHWAENRIRTFESVMNPPDGDKVCFPADLSTVEDAVDRIAADATVVPADVEESGRFDDAFRHFRHKHGTYWRWVRPVFEGATRRDANARIEFRPLPAQPTVRDSVAFLAAFAGLMESLSLRGHPVETLAWETARENFYAAMRDGLGADLTWVNVNGVETSDLDEIYGELFEYARDGLTLRGLSGTTAESYLDLLRGRVAHRTTPAGWKHERVRERVSEGASIEEAVYGMQEAYLRRQATTVVEGSFLDWLGEARVATV